MTTEELLKPRYKVIADYPTNNRYPVGKTITVITEGAAINENRHPVFWCDFDQYPHLFKKLEWWEEREVEDMPKYVGYKLLEDSKEKILKVLNHFADSNGGYNKRVFCIKGVPYSYSKCRIATLEEHEQYLQSLKTK